MTSTQQSRFWEDDDDSNDESTYSYDEIHRSFMEDIYSSDSSSSEEEIITISKRRIVKREKNETYRINRFNRCFATGRKIPLDTLYECQYISKISQNKIVKILQ